MKYISLMITRDKVVRSIVFSIPPTRTHQMKTTSAQRNLKDPIGSGPLNPIRL